MNKSKSTTYCLTKIILKFDLIFLLCCKKEYNLNLHNGF